jgi:hypothetical protein
LGRACSSVGEMRNTHDALPGVSEKKRSLGRHRHRWEVNTKINLKELGYVVWNKLNYPSNSASSSVLCNLKEKYIKKHVFFICKILPITKFSNSRHYHLIYLFYSLASMVDMEAPKSDKKQSRNVSRFREVLPQVSILNHLALGKRVP